VKQQILFSPNTAEGSGTSETVKRLAARYNIPEKDVEALLYGSQAPKSEAFGSDIKGKIMADEFRPGYEAPPPRHSGWSPVNILSLIVGILGIMSLSIILIHVLRDQKHDYNHIAGTPPPPTTAPNAPPAPVQDSTYPRKDSSAFSEKPDEIPPTEIQNEAAKPAPVKHHRTAIHSSGFTTPNSMEAQEHLAELRAEGNTRAKIRQSLKNGVTVYSIR
jgi:hypothetical protein